MKHRSCFVSTNTWEGKSSSVNVYEKKNGGFVSRKQLNIAEGSARYATAVPHDISIGRVITKSVFTKFQEELNALKFSSCLLKYGNLY
jgi:hypothetical protein